jgi:hypothetical protein
MGLRSILGAPAGDVSWSTVSTFLRENYRDNADEQARRASAAKRDRLYRGEGDSDMRELIDIAFANPLVRSLRKVLVEFSKWANTTARIVNEKATVYSEPAARHVGDDDETYQEFLDLVEQDEVMRQLNRLLCLHEDIWVQYRVRVNAEGDREPVIDLVSPALFWAVHYPSDPTQLAAVILDQKPTYKHAKPTDPHYRVWSPDETYQLDEGFRIIEESYEATPQGRMPGFIATTVKPAAKGRLLAENPNADLTAAHLAVWFQNVLLIKESKSANRQVFVTGDISTATMGQSSDTETDMVLPEGAVPQAVDRGMDLAQFRENANHTLETTGANHGLPPSVLHHRDASSGSEIHLRRIPLRELRNQQIPIMRRIERKLVAIQAMVNAEDLPEYAFDATGFAIDFGEVAQPLTESERDQVFETRRRLLLTDTVEEELRRNPDLRTPADAVRRIQRRVENEVARVAMTQELARLNGSTSSAPDDATPEENAEEGEQP